MQAEGFFTFDAAHLSQLAKRYAAQYRSAQPFPHVVIDDFLPRGVAQRLLREFPTPDSGILKTRNTPRQPGKYGTLGAENLPQASGFIQHVLLTLNGYALLDFLQELTGIEHLVGDPYFTGGGLHQIVNGGHLDVHADFSFDERTQLYRRLNLLLYLNPVWYENYGGYLELWERDMSACARRIAPLFNRCVVFSTLKDSFHGHPQPVKLPPGLTRNSIATYYYTALPPEGGEKHATLWQQLPPTDGKND